MDTRCGDIDPGMLLYLSETLGLSPPALDELLNKRSGIAGMCGLRCRGILAPFPPSSLPWRTLVFNPSPSPRSLSSKISGTPLPAAGWRDCVCVFAPPPPTHHQHHHIPSGSAVTCRCPARSDMRNVEKAAIAGNEDALLAEKVYVQVCAARRVSSVGPEDVLISIPEHPTVIRFGYLVLAFSGTPPLAQIRHRGGPALPLIFTQTLEGCLWFSASGSPVFTFVLH
jgi:hypothetical protein